MQERVYEQEARKGHAEYTKNGCSQIAGPQFRLTTVDQPNAEPCTPTEKAKQENDNRRDYADLVAQRSAALWAKIMGIAALIGIGLSLVGVVVIWITFRETKRANEIAGEIGFNQLRPYITVENAKRSHTGLSGENRGFSAAEITIHNSGNTPAVSASIYVDKIDVIEGIEVIKIECIQIPDVGGQSRRKINIPWYNWQNINDANLGFPKVITGKIVYKTAIFNTSGATEDFTYPFSIEATQMERRDVVEVNVIGMPDQKNF